MGLPPFGEYMLGFGTRHKLLKLWVGRGAGADAGDEAKGKDEEDSGYGADRTEYACAFEAAEEAANHGTGQRGCASNQVSDIEPKEAQRDDEKSCERAGNQPDGGNRGGRAWDLDGATDGQTQNGTENSPAIAPPKAPRRKPLTSQTKHLPDTTPMRRRRRGTADEIS